MDVLSKIISQSDIVAIQEIRDKSGQAIKDLEVAVDDLGRNYDFLVGPRLGRSNSKEQYAAFTESAPYNPVIHTHTRKPVGMTSTWNAEIIFWDLKIARRYRLIPKAINAFGLWPHSDCR
jgi:hypothetical protein